MGCCHELFGDGWCELAMRSTKLWALLPTQSMTERLRCKIFRMMCLEGADYERVVARSHRLHPYRLFLASTSPQVATDLKRLFGESPCMFDDFSKAFMEKFDIEEERARMALITIMMCSKTDTAAIECWHAWIRRMCTRVGTQAHRMNFWDVSARSIAHRIKRRDGVVSCLLSSLASGGPRPTDPAPSGAASSGAHEPPQEDPQGKRHRGGDGAWRHLCF